MAVEWTEDLATGVDLIDAQHKELFRRFSVLIDACRKGKGKEEVREMHHFLGDYVVTHFSEEEKHMQRYQYPDYAYHRAKHLEFMETFATLSKEFETDGPKVYLIVKTNQMIVKWLINHIRRVDRALGTFLKTKI